MNCFQLVKSVLDYAYDNIPGSESEKDAAIREQLSQLSKEYKQVATLGSLNYSDPLRRFAYVYKYTTSHANMVHECCGLHPAFQDLLGQEAVNIAAIGGGPGSDFLGILKYCETQVLSPSIYCQIFDRDNSWGETWGDVGMQLSSSGPRLHSNFLSLDVTDRNSWSRFTRYHQSNLVTLVYFMSEVWTQSSAADEFFQNLFQRAQPGTLFLFIDNDDSRISGWFDGLAKTNSVTILAKNSKKTQMSFDEQASDLAEYYQKFSSPKLQGQIAYRIGRKV